MGILPVRWLTRPSPPLDRLAAEGGEQRSQTGCIGVQESVVILARALRVTDRFEHALGSQGVAEVVSPEKAWRAVVLGQRFLQPVARFFDLAHLTQIPSEKHLVVYAGVLFYQLL